MRAGRNRLFTSTRETEEYARRSISNEIRKLQRAIPDERTLQEYLTLILRGLPDQLFNMPLDMFIEYHLHQQHPFLYSSQVASIHNMMQEGIKGLDPNIQHRTPSRIWQASIALNCALALFVDDLYNGATAYADAYRKSGQYHNGEKLFQLWQQQIDEYEPGSEYELVDAFAKELKLERWYTWQEDQTGEKDLAPGTQKAGLPKEQEPTAVIYCLSALKKFQGMDQQEIFSLVSEIALLGQSGLDFTSANRKYTLASMRGEFSGLQLICYLYVGFQIIDPKVDTGVDLAEAYAQAKRMYERGM